MATATAREGGSGGPPSPSLNLSAALQIVIVLLVDAFGIALAIGMASDGNSFFAIAIILALVLVTAVTVIPGLWPLKWISPALALLILLSIYPLLYTVYVAFTNFSDGHRFTKIEAIELLADRRYLPEGGATYNWQLYQNEAGDYGLWLTDAAGASFFATQGAFASVTGEAPPSYDGFILIEGGARFRALNEVQGSTFGDEANAVGIQSMQTAGAFVQQWTYDSATDTLTDNATGTAYRADEVRGEFISSSGQTAPLGYWVTVGFNNFVRIAESTLSQGPLIRVILWTIAFAVLGTLSSFALGLVQALLLNGSEPWLRIVRTLLLVPYAVPGLVSVLVWRGMLNLNIGVIPNTLEAIFGRSPEFAVDPGWAKVAVLLVNVWFGAPYFMLIGSGALQSISSSVYEAAMVDGASRWVQFWSITLPLVLVALGPLLVASVIFNFNNFFLMEGLFGGGPPIVGTTAPPVGHTDNLISYTYRLAFSSGGTKDYGLAAALGVVIFMVVGLLTLMQFRLTRTWEQVSENV